MRFAVPRPGALLAAASLAAATLAAAPAHAGGIGILGHGGIHTEKAYYYSNVSEGGSAIDDPKNYRQFKQSQILPQFGGGLEFILGDRDDKIIGVFRAAYNMDAAQKDPADSAKNVASGRASRPSSRTSRGSSRTKRAGYG